MTRRHFIALLSGVSVTRPLAAAGQQAGRVHRIGVLSTALGPASPVVQGMREGLKQLGYIEGQNLVIEVRSGEGRNDRLPAVAAELVGLRVEIIVTAGPYALEAAKDATTSIPIVFSGVGSNFAPARGSGNLTGVAEELVESTVKRLAMLKEAVPGLMRIAILANPNNYGTQAYLPRCREWAQSTGVTLQIYDVRHPDDIAPTFARMASEHAEGLLAFTDSIIFGQREKIVQTALRNGLPGSYPYREWVTGGGLLSYGPNLTTILRGPVPAMIDKIFKGAKPSDLPVEQARLELFINLKTAKVFGLTLPKSLLARADELIE